MVIGRVSLLCLRNWQRYMCLKWGEGYKLIFGRQFLQDFIGCDNQDFILSVMESRGVILYDLYLKYYFVVVWN